MSLLLHNCLAGWVGTVSADLRPRLLCCLTLPICQLKRHTHTHEIDINRLLLSVIDSCKVYVLNNMIAVRIPCARASERDIRTSINLSVHFALTQTLIQCDFDSGGHSPPSH